MRYEELVNFGAADGWETEKYNQAAADQQRYEYETRRDKMKFSDAFPSKYLSSDDLDGREIKLTIGRIELEEIGRDRDKKPVIYFTKAKKGMVLNKTNARAIAAAYGDEMTQWEDREIILFSMKVQFGDEIVDGIRVRIPQAAPAPKPAPAHHSELDPPFDDAPPF